MLRKTIYTLLVGLICCHLSVAQVFVDALTCELIENPLVIDSKDPRLAWKITSDERGVKQLGYHILVASTKDKLDSDNGDLWDSGQVNSSNSIAVFYQGEPLKSRQECFWKVKVFTNKGGSDWSSVNSWKMGLLNYKDWQGRWIGFDRYFESDNDSLGKLSARYFRKEIELKKEVKQASVYIMGVGLYELYLNGDKVGDHVLAPTPTDYTQNIKYNVFDVTSALKKGTQALGVILGNGRFYAMRQAKPYKVKSFGFPKMQLQLEVVYIDGSKEVFKTDNSWKGTSEGPILSNNEYDGEDYDARKEWDGWSSVGFDDTAWRYAEYVQEPGGEYEAQMNSPMKVMQDITPVAVIDKGEGRYILDFGQNFSGWVKMRVSGTAGDQIKLRFAESLQENGEIFVTNLRDAKSTDTYILKGKGVEEWEPRFTYHGFRFVEVSGYPGRLMKEHFTGRFVYDEMDNVGRFNSSNMLLNQIHQNAWWGIASNYKGMPIDCPQRNERQPWLGDRPASAYGETFLFDNTNFYIKWLDDIRCSQKSDGAIPDVAPAFWRYYSDNMTWPGTYIIIADMLYKQQGDIRIIRQHYEPMKKWLSYMRSRYWSGDGLLTKDSYGDWCFPPVSIEAGRGKIADKKYPSALIASAYYYHLLEIMSRFGQLLGEKHDDVLFAEQAKALKEAFNVAFYHDEGYYGEDKMTDNILALYFGLVEERHVELLQKRLVKNIEVDHQGHLATGLVGVQWLMRTLSSIGREDLALKIATNTTYPSWGYMVENGATTIWELWNGNTAHPKMNSQNHVMMLGDLLVWYYENLAGIKSAENAFQIIEMHPSFVEGLDFVEASYESPYGTIASSWRKTKKNLEWTVSIPPNSSAKISIPSKNSSAVTEGGRSLPINEDVTIKGFEAGRTVMEINSGTYIFKAEL